MTQYLTFALLGLGAGALFASLALGLVIAQKGSGVLNLSQGAMAMYVAYTYAGLRSGRLMIPPLPNPLAPIAGIVHWCGWHWRMPDWPTFISLHSQLGALPAAVIALAEAAFLGLVVHVFIFRPLRTAPALAKTIASVGVLLFLQAVIVLRFGTQNVSVAPLLPQHPVDILGARVPEDRLLMLGIIVAMTIVLAFFFRNLRLGRAIRAAAENERGALLVGLNPNRLAAVTWMMSTLAAGFVGILFASVSGLDPTDYVLFVIPALAAAMAARFESFSICLAAGMLIGCAESVTVLLQKDLTWFPSVGAAQGIPFVVLVAAMIWRGRSLPQRGGAIRVRLPKSPEPGPVAPAVVFAIAVLIGLFVLPFDLRLSLINSMIAAVVALSLVVVTGFAGQVSIIQMSIAGLTALLMARWGASLGISFPWDALLAIAVAAVAGTLVGLPAVRIRGVHLAVVTLAGAYVFENMVLDNTNYLRVTDQNPGAIHTPGLFGLSFGIDTHVSFGPRGAPSPLFGIFVLIILAVCGFVVRAIRRSNLGLRFLAIRMDEAAAAALGIRVPATKLLAFGIGSTLAAVGGALSGYQFQSVTAEPYLALASVSALAFAYLGGITSVTGALMAGTIAAGGLSFAILQRYAHMGQFEPLISGLGLILVTLMNPEGIAGVLREQIQWLRRSRIGIAVHLWRESSQRILPLGIRCRGVLLSEAVAVDGGALPPSRTKSSSES